MSNSSGSSSESDIEIKTRLVPQKKVTLPSSPKEHLHQEPKKIPVKDMVHAALKELNTRKGVSLHAVKKYMVEKFNVDTLKINLYIKKYVKSGVEAGTIVQTKGIGASGSFKLAPEKKTEKKTKKKNLAKPDAPKKEKSDKSKKTDTEKGKLKKKTSNTEDGGKMIKTNKTKAVANKTKEKTEKDKEQKKLNIKSTKESKEEKVAKDPKKVQKSEKSKAKSKVKVTDNQTPVKKSTMIRKKSIGSIIKPPKMKPKMRD